MPDDPWPVDASSDFRITLLKERTSERRAVELHVPGFFTWILMPSRAAALAEELRWAASDAMAGEKR